VDLRLVDDEDVNDMSGLEVAKFANAQTIPCVLITAFPTVRVARAALSTHYADVPLAIELIPKIEGPESILRIVESLRRQLSSVLNILHLSDIHIEDISQAKLYRAQLEADLIAELQIHSLDYLVMSGDIANRALPEEYDAACFLIDGLVQQFGLRVSRIITVPGNHDVNWAACRNAYKFIYKDDLPNTLVDGQFYPAGDAGVLLRQEEAYRQRFEYFNDIFYKRITSCEYPIDYAHQSVLYTYPEHKILFLGLNSAWNLDAYFKNRAGIHPNAISNAMEKVVNAHAEYDGWLKIAVVHHPVTGPEQMQNTNFMQSLAVAGFQTLLHGHIHEAEHGFYNYDRSRDIHIVGAGTFGAPTRQQIPSIPHQYNLLVLHPATGESVVQTRKKEKPDGAWSADARWGDKNNPIPYYSLNMNKKWRVWK
jgi:hypothetical protein